MGTYIFSSKAQADILEISNFLLDTSDMQTATRNLQKIHDDLQYLADTPMLGTKAGGKAKYRFWYLLGNKYKVYFQRLSDSEIRVLRIRSTRSAPLDLKDLDI